MHNYTGEATATVSGDYCLVAKHGTGVVVLSRVLAVCEAFDIPSRLLVSLESCSRERWVEVNRRGG